jgi:sugar fermentation stimulation protein A
MQFHPALIEARLIRRYKRFLADMEIDGAAVTVHCPNPGSMLGLADPGNRAWLTPKTGTKLPYAWEIVETGPQSPIPGSLVGIHTGRANALVAEALRAGAWPGFPNATIQPEVKVGARAIGETESRLDFRLAGADGTPCWVEVKSVTLSRRAGLAEFPDARTLRGARHLKELALLAQAGQRAVLLFLVQRSDCGAVGVAADIDPGYAQALALARAQGVEIRAFSCRIDSSGIDAGPEIAFIR